MTRLYGRCLKKTRLHAAAPSGRWRTTTMISSIRLDGTTACMTIEGATNSEIFYQYIKEILLPTLNQGDIESQKYPEESRSPNTGSPSQSSR